MPHAEGAYWLGADTGTSLLLLEKALRSLEGKMAGIKFPLPCGCAGPKYISMCQAHQALEREQHADQLMRGEEVRQLRERIKKLEAEIEKLEAPKCT